MNIGETIPFMYGNERMTGVVHKLGNVDGIPSVMFKVDGGYITKPVEKVIEQNSKFDNVADKLEDATYKPNLVITNITTTS